MIPDSPVRLLAVPAWTLTNCWEWNLASADGRGAEVRKATPVASKEDATVRKSRCVLVARIAVASDPLLKNKLASDPRESADSLKKAHHLTTHSSSGWRRLAGSTGPPTHLAGILAAQSWG